MSGVPLRAKESSSDSRLTLPVSVSWSWEAAAPLNHTPITYLAMFLSFTPGLFPLCV